MYRVKSRLLHNHKEYNEGDTIELKDEYADPLLGAGIIELVSEEEASKTEVKVTIKEEPENDSYYCSECEHNHRRSSGVGQRHLKYAE